MNLANDVVGVGACGVLALIGLYWPRLWFVGVSAGLIIALALIL